MGLGAVRRVLAAPRVTDGPYGPLGPPDANGLKLPKGFTSRVIARGGRPVGRSGYVWHTAPDGGATFPGTDGGWIYVSNSEVNAPNGGVGAIRFDRAGNVVDAYPIATKTSRNCAGGPTPWGTWLSCEEHETGRVWECDPTGRRKAVVRPALGVFQHESAAVDPVNKRVYLTEDEPDGRFYRFTPKRYPSLDAGTLEVAQVSVPDGATKWIRVPDPTAASTVTRRQVPLSTVFNGGEGTWYAAGAVYFTTKGDDRVWAYDTEDDRMSVIYDPVTIVNAPLRGVDNITGSKSGDLFVAEDGGDLEIVMITPDETVARLLHLTGAAHEGSEIAGPAFDPSNKRLYFSSQRGDGKGITFEVRGPFRTKATKPMRRSPPPAPVTQKPVAQKPVAQEKNGPPVGAIAGAAAGGGVAAVLGRRFIGRRRRAGGDRSGS
jgi:sugar lactone lactonase YvrE